MNDCDFVEAFEAAGLDYVSRGKWRSFRQQTVDPRAILRAGDAEVGNRATDVRAARCASELFCY